MHGNGLGAPSPEEVERRAREIAMIDERNPDEFTEADWKQARHELMGAENHTPPEETPDNADLTEEWNVVASSKGHAVAETVGGHLEQHRDVHADALRLRDQRMVSRMMAVAWLGQSPSVARDTRARRRQPS